MSNKNVIPVITLYQPWASWVILGLKDIETRTHSRFKNLVGKTVGIHAGKWDNGPYTNPVINPYISNKDLQYVKDEPTGSFLGTVVFEKFSELNFEHSWRAMIDCDTSERFGLFVDKRKTLEYSPVKCPGSMGIWYFDLDKMEKVLKTPKIQTALW